MTSTRSDASDQPVIDPIAGLLAVVLPGAGWEMKLNAEAAHAITVEVGTERFQLLPAYSGPAAGRCADRRGLDCPVTWRAANAQKLAGKTVRFRFQLRQDALASPRLFAVYLEAK